MSSIRERVLFGNKRGRATATTTDGTATALSFAGGAMVLPNNTTWLFVADVAARRSDSGTESAGYTLRGVVRRGANAASTALVGSVGQTVVGEDTVAWDATLAVDTTAGGVKINVTGEAAKTIKWTAQVRLTAA